jgi:predicted transposase/invertase (TIGR01784 family)
MKRDDTLWKGLIESLFEDFLRMVYPDADNHFDFEKGITFLDKELHEIAQVTKSDWETVKIMDLLAGLHLKGTGENLFFLAHVDIQGNPQADFEERMFYYFLRALDSLNKRVVSWAILIDSNKNWKPTIFLYEFFGTEARYKFNVLKLLDLDLKTLEASNNPFATALYVALSERLNVKTKELDPLKLKVKLARKLFEKQYAPEKVRCIMNFLKFCIRLPEEKERIFAVELQNLTNKKSTMGLEEMILEKIKTEGLQKGLKKGLQKGLKEGRQEGRQEANLIAIKNGLTKGYSLDILSDLLNLSQEDLLKLIKEHKLG